VVLAGIAQAFFQLPSLTREGFRYAWVSPWHDPTVREVVRKMLPGSIGVAAFQINVLLTQSFSFWFDPTIVATFNYSVRLMELPQGMFGISLATFLLPTLTGLASRKKFDEFRHTLSQGLSYLAFANLIAAAIALALAGPIVRLIFEHGKFDSEATARVALALTCLAPGLLLFSMNNILARAFYALSDVWTPMKISVFCLCLNLVFAFWLVHPYREAGLAVANSLSALINAGLLAYALRRKLARLAMGEALNTLLLLVPTAVLAGIVAALLNSWWERALGHATLTLKLGAVFVPGSAAGMVYWMAALALRVPAAGEMTQLLLKKLRRG
jgi:putative peptidoglycan lipid II flippase